MVATGHISDVLRTPDDYLDWRKHIELCEEMDGLTAEQRLAAQRALEHLQRTFGRSFLRNIGGTAHPLAYWVRNTVPWTRLWLVRVSEAICAMKTVEGFNRLLGKLSATDEKHLADSIEAFSMLELAYKFLTSGFGVAIEPAVVVANARGKAVTLPPDAKHPDLKLRDPRSGKEVFVEVTALTTGQKLRESQITSDWLWWIALSYLWSDDLVRCIQVERMLTDAERCDLTKRVKQLVVSATDTHSLQTIDNEEIKVGVAPVSCKADLVAWANARRLELGIAGIPINLDNEMNRLINYKLHRKMKEGQLPPGRPGILVIIDQSMLTPVFSSLEIASNLIEASRQYSNLLCVVVTRMYCGPAETQTPLDLPGGHLIIDRAVADPLREQTIIVLNDGYKLSGECFERVRAAFS